MSLQPPASSLRPGPPRASFAVVVSLLLAACGTGESDTCPRGRPIVSVQATSGTQVDLVFACDLDEGSASDASVYAVEDCGAAAAGACPRVSVVDAEADGNSVRLGTAQMTALTTYTLRLLGVRDAAGNALTGSVNFAGVGKSNHSKVTLEVDDRYNQNLKAVQLLASFDPLTGLFSHTPRTITLDDKDGDHVFTRVVDVAVDPSRTKDTKDDRLGAQYMAYSVRAVDDQSRPLSSLVLFEAKDQTPQTVKVPLLTVPDKPPVEGRVTVTFKVDDRPARALSQPSLKLSIDSKGQFDANFSSTVSLSDDDGDDVWEGTAKVWIDPSRTLTGKSSATQPYSAYLVEGTTDYTARSADFAVQKEEAVTVSILIGSTTKVPVTFRVDVSKAWLDLTGSNLGVWPGEAVFITGELGTAEDAFGQNASDAFSGGENVVLQMVERKDKKGVWERTIFLPKTTMERPYGWKVVRCIKDTGCTQINKMVTSTGRAFPTVMKNLVTELCDAGKKSWTDKNCRGPKVIDPRDLTKVDTGAGTLDYSRAKVWAGLAGSGAETDPAGTPAATLMFKQEIPDLVVNVKDKAVETPVHVIGTWRDVNITGTPKDIIAGGTVIDLAKTDYDAGFTGGTPPSYTLPPATRPSPFKMDGTLDTTAKLIAGGTTGGGTMPIYAAVSGNHLYLATDDAGEGSDNFVVISATAPTSAPLRPCPWAKGGTMAFAGKTLFMADENDFAYAAWFELAASSGGQDTLRCSMGVSGCTGMDIFAPAQNGGYLEATIDLRTVFGSMPSFVYVMAAPWGNGNGGALYSPAQTPKTKNGDGNVDSGEILKVAIPGLTTSP